MPELSFAVEKAEAEPFAAAPLLLFKLRVRQAPPLTPVHAAALRCQIRIEPAKRPYAAGEQEKLLDLFGTPDRWGRTLRPMLWTRTSAVLPPFTESVLADLPAPCTFDFNVAATKYFNALAEGDAPLTLLFSGTMFYEGDEGALQVAQIPWDREAAFRLPIHVWKEMMDRYYPNSAWLNLRRDVFDRLYDYKSRRGLPTWEQALESLLPADGRGSP